MKDLKYSIKTTIRKFLNENYKIKTDVDYVFKENPYLSEIGSKEEYTEYLDMVFPNSKVKDIVYHGTNTKEIEGGRLRPSSDGTYGKGIYTQTKPEFTGTYGLTSLPLLINTKKPFPFYINGNPNKLWLDIRNKYENSKKYYWADIAKEEFRDKIKELNYDSIEIEAGGGNIWYLLFEPEQVHILSGEVDIKGFKDYVTFKDSGF